MSSGLETWATVTVLFSMSFKTPLCLSIFPCCQWAWPAIEVTIVHDFWRSSTNSGPIKPRSWSITNSRGAPKAFCQQFLNAWRRQPGLWFSTKQAVWYIVARSRTDRNQWPVLRISLVWKQSTNTSSLNCKSCGGIWCLRWMRGLLDWAQTLHSIHSAASTSSKWAPPLEKPFQVFFAGMPQIAMNFSESGPNYRRKPSAWRDTKTDTLTRNDFFQILLDRPFHFSIGWIAGATSGICHTNPLNQNLTKTPLRPPEWCYLVNIWSQATWHTPEQRANPWRFFPSKGFDKTSMHCVCNFLGVPSRMGCHLCSFKTQVMCMFLSTSL